MDERIGDYELIGPLGSGAMGAVFRARDLKLGREVAIKTLIASTPRTLTRFAREAAAIARLQHPAIVKLHEAKLDDPRPHLVMSYVEGESLESRLAHGGPLPPERVQQIGVALAEALAHAHAHGVLHRDLKPGNVLLGADGRVYLSDFGLAKDMGSEDPLTRTGQIVGTPAFMSPEQARGRRAAIGPGTDVYGLGATLYAALTGRPPFEQATFMALMVAVTSESPAPITRRVPDLDPGLASVVMRCLAKRPEDRFETAAALAAALAAPETHTPPRSPWPWIAGGAAVLAALAALAVSRSFAQPTPALEPSGPVPLVRPVAGGAPTAPASPAIDPSSGWIVALRRAKHHLDQGDVERGLHALRKHPGQAPAVPALRTFRRALSEATERLLPGEVWRPDSALDTRNLPDIIRLVQLMQRLPQRPPLEPRLWVQLSQLVTRNRLDGAAPQVSLLQSLVADLDPDNLDLQIRVVCNAHLSRTPRDVLKAAKRLAARPELTRVERLQARVRLAIIHAHRPPTSRDVRAAVAAADAAVALVERAQAEAWKLPRSTRIPYPVGRSPLDDCGAQARLARAKSLLKLEQREAQALADLTIAGRHSADTDISFFKILAAERLGAVPLALRLASQLLELERANVVVRSSVIPALWRIHATHGQGLALLRKQMGKLLEQRFQDAPPWAGTWVCLAWLDHLAGDLKQRDERLAHARSMLSPAAVANKKAFQRLRRDLARLDALLKAGGARGPSSLRQLALQLFPSSW